MNCRLIALAIILAVFPVVAMAQNLVAGGTKGTPGHGARWVAPGVLGDAGGAGGSQIPGVNYSELGITNTGTPFGINDALQSAQGGYHSLTLGANALGGGMINYQANAGAQPLPLQICANGQCVQFPFNLTGVQGPATSVAGDFACWNDTSGTLLKDCGVSPTTVGCPSIVMFGGVGNNSTDNAPALAAAVAAQGSRICVFFPPGQFKFASAAPITLSAPYGAVTILGSGPGVTELIGAPGLGVIALTKTSQYNTYNFQDFSVEASSPCSGCKGISVVQSAATTAEGETPTSYFTRVHLYGTDRNINQGGSTNGVNYWGTAIYLQGESNVNFEGLFIQGLFSVATPPAQYGIDVETTGSNTPVVFNLHGVVINSFGTGLHAATVVQGLTVSQSNFTDDQIGIEIAPGSGSGGQLTVTASQFDCNTAVAVNSIWGGVQVSGSTFFMGQVGNANWVGLDFGQPASFITISGNFFGGTGGPGTAGTFGVSTASAPHSGIITGNTFAALNTGILLNTGASNWVVNPNWYLDNTTNLFIAGSGFGNVINTSVSGGAPTLSSNCGSGASLQGASTDQSGLIIVGSSPGTACTLIFNTHFKGTPICMATNYTSASRVVTTMFAASDAVQIASQSTLSANDELAYHCDGYQ